MGRRLMGAAVAAAFVLAGCEGAGSPSGAGAGLEQGLLDLAGVNDAVVDVEELDAGVEETVATVDLAGDVTAREAAAVLERLEGARRDEQVADWVAYLDAGTAEYAAPELGGPNDAVHPSGTGAVEPLVSAHLLLDAAGAVDADDTIIVGGRDLTVGVEQEAGGADAGVVADRLRRLQAAGVAVGEDGASTLGVVAGAADSGWRPTATFTTQASLDDGVIATWERFAGSVPEALRGPDNHLRATFAASEPAPEVRLDATVTVPGPVEPRRLTPERYGDQVWPMVRAQLDLLREAADGSRLTVSNGSDAFIEVATGVRPGADEFGRTWSVEAHAYLTGE